MPPLRFRTMKQRLYRRNWDRAWLREVSQHAKIIVVRLSGFSMMDRVGGPPSPDHPATLAYERGMIAMTGVAACACVFLYPLDYQYPHNFRPLHCENRFRLTLRTRWHWWTRSEAMSHRVAYMMHNLRGAVPCPIVLHTEDFAARWALNSGFTPDMWLLENPMIGRDEALDRWPEQLNRPGSIRRSHHWRFNYLDFYRLHLKRQELLTYGMKITGDHGEWTTKIGNALRPRPDTTLLRQIEELPT